MEEDGKPVRELELTTSFNIVRPFLSIVKIMYFCLYFLTTTNNYF